MKVKKLIVAVVALATALLAPDSTQLSSVQCDPVRCEEAAYVYPYTSGFVETDIYGQCYNGRMPSAVGAVDAYNCSTWIYLESWAGVTSAQYLDDFGRLYTVEGVKASADAYHPSKGIYWSMYEDRDCQGGHSVFIDPPASC